MLFWQISQYSLITILGIGTVYIGVIGWRILKKERKPKIDRLNYLLVIIGVVVTAIGGLQIPDAIQTYSEQKSEEEQLYHAELAFDIGDYKTVFDIYSHFTNNPIVKTNLGIMHLYGIGFTEENESRAMAYFDSAIADGYSKASLYKISHYFYNGLIGPAVTEIILNNGEPALEEFVNSIYKGIGKGDNYRDFLSLSLEDQIKFFEDNLYYWSTNYVESTTVLGTYSTNTFSREYLGKSLEDKNGDKLVYHYEESRRMMRYTLNLDGFIYQ